MSLTTVTGRVRGTVRLKAEGAGARVVATSWASDRTFPRTTGAAVAFDLEAGDGAVYRVDPFEALVALPVRETAVRAGVRHEAAWIAVEDEITVEGELERAGRGRAPPSLRARRIAMTKDGGAALHRVPPRALQRAETERIEAAPAVLPADTTVVNVPVGDSVAEVAQGGEVAQVAEVAASDAPAPPASAEAATPASPDSATPASPESATPDASAASRKTKKKRPDSSGTPTPIQ